MNPVIPNKYLQTNLNRYETGPSALVKAQNVRLDGGRIRSRIGQDLAVDNTTDLPFQYLGGPTFRSFRPVKAFWYNNRPWVYWRNNADNLDGIAYYDFPTKKWVQNGQFTTYLSGAYQNVDGDVIPPQFQEANNRLLFGSFAGVYVSAKLDKEIVDFNNVGYQTNMIRAGCPRALPIVLGAGTAYLINTTGTYNQNWIVPGEKVAYRTVWKKTNENGCEIYGPVSCRTVVKNTDAANRAIRFDLQIPEEILGLTASEQARFSIEVYRTKSTPFNSAGVGAPDPGDEEFKVMELRPTATDITNKKITYTDIISSVALGPPLYSNASQYGYLSSRERPPISRSMAYWHDRAFYANVTTELTNEVSILSVLDPGAAAGSETGIRKSDVLIMGPLALEADNPITKSSQFLLDSSSGIGNQIQRIINTTRSIVEAANSDHTAYRRFDAHQENGPDDFFGRILCQETFTGAAINAFGNNGYKHYFGLYRKNGWPGSNDPSPLHPVPLVQQGKGKGFLVTSIFFPPGVGVDVQFTLDSAADFVADDYVNLAAPVGNPIGFAPGVYQVKSVAGAVVTLQQYTTSAGPVTYTAGAGAYATFSFVMAMHCVRSTANKTESPAVSSQVRLPNAVMYSPIQEPESAPWSNSFRVGASDGDVICLKPLNDTLFVFKSDGLYRVTEDDNGFSQEIVDRSLVLVGPDLVCELDNNLYALTTRGVYKIGEQTYERISYDIQNELDLICSANTAAVRLKGFSVTNPEDHTAMFWLPSTVIGGASSTRCDVCYVYDGNGWTKRYDQANGACSGKRYDASDQCHLYTAKDQEGWLTIERKARNVTDYCDEAFIFQATSLSNISALRWT